MAKIECSNRWLEIAQLLKVDIKNLIEADFNYDIE